MTKHALTVALSATLWAAAAVPALADHDCEESGCYTQASSPQWVMTFSLDSDGQLLFEGSGRSADYMLEGAVVHHRASRRNVEDEPVYRIVVASDQPFCLPVGFPRHQAFPVRSQWRPEHSQRLCRLLGVRPGAVRVVATSCGPVYVKPRQHRARVVARAHTAWPWCEVNRADRIYIDGRFSGEGFAALVDVSVGPHRVTLVTSQGHKTTRWVTFPDGRCGSECDQRVVCR